MHAWIAQKEYNIEETKKLLALKLTHITPDNIVSPESYIAIPALQQISYSMNNESLRDLYANLLAKAMNKETKNAVHPAFVDIIKQLSPDEALLNKYIYEAYTRSDNCFAIPLLIVSEVYPDKTSKTIIHGFSDFLDKAGCREKINAKFYFDNLVRLQILTNTTGSLFPNPNAENKHDAENHPYIIDLKKEIEGRKNTCRITKVGYYNTGLGEAFAQICIFE